ncbi:MAG TPA: hypothetical protein VF650_14930 [Allosphingosinicella sp.]|jgi:hypothetical protein
MTLRLELESGVAAGPIDGRAVESALASLGTEAGSPGFAILSKGPSDEHYVQTHVDEAGIIVEMRNGHAGAHFMARRSTFPDSPPPERNWWQFCKVEAGHDRFTLAEVSNIFRAPAEGAQPTFWRWMPLEHAQ